MKILQCIVEVVVSRHDKSASHLIELVPTHAGGAVRRVGVGADAETKLVIILE